MASDNRRDARAEYARRSRIGKLRELLENFRLPNRVEPDDDPEPVALDVMEYPIGALIIDPCVGALHSQSLHALLATSRDIGTCGGSL